MSSTVIVHGVSLELPNGRTLFHQISFTLNSRTTALVGPNGVGKSCLAKLIAGELLPTTGTVHRKAPVRYFRQKESPPFVTVRDYLADRYSWSLLGEKLLMGIEQSMICTNLSGGQWMRVRLAATIGETFLILDEPTNDLDAEAKSILKDFLLKYSFGILLISHDREFLRLCDEVLELSNQGLSKFGMGWQAYEIEKQRQQDQAFYELERSRRQRDQAGSDRIARMARQEKRNHHGKKASEKGGMPKFLSGSKKRQAQVTTGKIDMKSIEKAETKAKEAYQVYAEMKVDPVIYTNLKGAEIPNQKLVAEARHFNLRFETWLYPFDLNFTWKGNIRLAIQGAKGSGKTTLIKALLGQDFQTKGELRLGHLRILYVDQQCSDLDETLSIFDNVRSVSKLSESEIRNQLAQFLFGGDQVFQKVGTLSGGERIRATFAKGLLSEQKPELMILDEPTNNLDLGNIKFIENLVSQFRGAVIVVSHDEAFLKGCGIDTRNGLYL